MNRREMLSKLPALAALPVVAIDAAHAGVGGDTTMTTTAPAGREEG